jgi:hypothetical protein
MRDNHPISAARGLAFTGAAAAILAIIVLLARMEETPGLSAAGAQPEPSATPVAGFAIEATERPAPARLLPDRNVAPSEPAARDANHTPRDPSPPGDRPGDAAVFRGRVVDGRGRGVSGARVWYRPSRDSQAALGFATDGLRYADVPAEDRVHADTDTDGRFELRAPRLPDARPQRCFFAVTHHDLARRAVSLSCQGDGPWNLGEIVMHPGARCSGRVVDETGTPLPDVSVHATTTQPERPDRYYGDPVQGASDAIHWVRTDRDGRFTASGLAAGMARVHVRNDGGWAPHSSDEFAVRAGEHVDLGDLVLRRGAVLAGVVVDVDGAPIAGAQVLASTWWVEHYFSDELPEDTLLLELGYVGGSARTPRDRTATDGSFRLAGLAPAAVSVYASAPGHEPVKVRDVAPGRDDLVLVIAPQTRAEVLVVGRRDGAPLPGARLRAERRSGAPDTRFDYPLQVSPGEGSGAFVVEGLGPAGTRLLATAEGFADEVALLEVLEAPAGSPARLALDREASVAGRVVDAGGVPIAGATVGVAAADGSGVPGARVETVTDEQGRYRLGRLSAGAWWLNAEARDHTAPDSQRIVLAVGESLERPDVELQTAGSITGRVFRGDGTPCPGGELVVAQQIGGPHEGAGDPVDLRTWTDEAGRYAFDGLSAGWYELSTEARGSARAMVEAGLVTRADVHQHRRPSVSGRVTAGDSRIAGASADASRRTERDGRTHWRWSGKTTTGSDGLYRLELDEPGEYRIWIASPRGTALERRVGFVGWGEDVVGDVSFGTASLSGRVVDLASGEPLSDAWVQAESTDGPDSAWTDADTAGRFTIGHLLGGDYTVTAGGDEHLSASVGPLSLAAGDTLDDLRLELDGGGAIAGSVIVAAGTAVQDGTWVGLQRAGEEPLGWSGETVGGRFRFAALLPGAYRVVVMTGANRWTAHDAFEDHVVVERLVTVEVGGEVEVRLVVPEHRERP